MDELLETEFDTVAAWTEAAVKELGQDHAIPAACRGSGRPSDLAWLADGLELTDGDRFLDAGSGLGGPTAWLVAELGWRWQGPVLLAEPMKLAAAASVRLFGHPAVAAWTENLPLPDESIDAAWALGVLDTLDDKREVLTELHRVMRPGARLGLLVLVARGEHANDLESNSFPTDVELHRDLTACGFRVLDRVDTASLAEAPPQWTTRADAVEEVVARDHRSEEAWQQAEQQTETLTRLLDEREVVSVLLRTARV